MIEQIKTILKDSDLNWNTFAGELSRYKKDKKRLHPSGGALRERLYRLITGINEILYHLGYEITIKKIK